MITNIEFCDGVVRKLAHKIWKRPIHKTHYLVIQVTVKPSILRFHYYPFKDHTLKALLVGQWLRALAYNAGDTSSIPRLETKVSVTQPNKYIFKSKNPPTICRQGFLLFFLPPPAQRQGLWHFNSLITEGFPGAQRVKNLPAMQETQVQSLGNIPWRSEWLPTPVFLPAEFHGQRKLVGSTGVTNRLKQVSD